MPPSLRQVIKIRRLRLQFQPIQVIAITTRTRARVERLLDLCPEYFSLQHSFLLAQRQHFLNNILFREPTPIAQLRRRKHRFRIRVLHHLHDRRRAAAACSASRNQRDPRILNSIPQILVLALQEPEIALAILRLLNRDVRRFSQLLIAGKQVTNHRNTFHQAIAERIIVILIRLSPRSTLESLHLFLQRAYLIHARRTHQNIVNRREIRRRFADHRRRTNRLPLRV